MITNEDLRMLREVKTVLGDFIELFNYHNDNELMRSDKELLQDFINFVTRCSQHLTEDNGR